MIPHGTSDCAPRFSDSLIGYLSPVSYLLALAASAISIRRRIASGRPGLSGCFEAQASTLCSNSG
jgi:hypothetical protein